MLLEAKDCLQGAACRVQSLSALVELDQELEEVTKVSLLVTDKLSVLALELSGALVLDPRASVGRQC